MKKTVIVCSLEFNYLVCDVIEAVQVLETCGVIRVGASPIRPTILMGE
jgi:hypothetical protein